MDGENNPLSQDAVVERQQSAIEGFELVIPQDVKNSGLCPGRVEDESGVVQKDAFSFVRNPRARRPIASEVQESDRRVPVEFRTIKFIAPDNVEHHTLRYEFCRQAIGIWPVSAASQ